MFRNTSAASIKSSAGGKLSKQPREGSYTRELYDKLLSGQMLDAKLLQGGNRSRLVDEYGFVLKTVAGQVQLLGVYAGTEYISLERLTTLFDFK